MRNPKEVGRRWLEQAQHNLEVTRRHMEGQFWSDACFMAEQTAQVALKAYLYAQGERIVPLYSIHELALRCARRDAAFEAVVDGGKVLDAYYLASRYPDALAPPAVPYKSFTEAEAQQALSYAERVVALVASKLSLPAVNKSGMHRRGAEYAEDGPGLEE